MAGAGLFTGGVIELAGTSVLCCFGSPYAGPSGSSITVFVYYFASTGGSCVIDGFAAGARLTEARGGGCYAAA